MIILRDFLKVVYIFVVGLFMSVFVYPVLHEAGHLFATLAVGGNVAEVSVFPVAYTKCDIFSVSSFGQVIIGLSGMIFPMLFAWIRFKKFYMWYPVFVLRGIVLLSLAISLISIVLFYSGITIANEDVVQILQICSGYNAMVIGIVVGMTILSVILFLTDRPFRRFLKYLSD